MYSQGMREMQGTDEERAADPDGSVRFYIFLTVF